MNDFVRSVDDFRGIDDLFWARRTVFVNMLEETSAGYGAVEDAVKVLSCAGHVPVPHLSASSFASRAHATYVCDRLSRCGANDALIHDGGLKNSSAISAITLGEIAGHYFDTLAVSAYPEGNRDEDLSRNFSKAKIVTQWASTPESTSKWLTDFLKSDDNETQIHVGVCGPASRTKKQQFARLCGVNAQFDQSHVQQSAFKSPREAVQSLANDLEVYEVPEDRVRLHLFAIGLGRTLDFLHILTARDLNTRSTLLAA